MYRHNGDLQDYSHCSTGGSHWLHYGSRERPELLTSESAALVMLPKEVTLHLNFSWNTVLENIFNMRTDTVIPICKEIHSGIS
jgi:hypothetical protein